MTSQNEEQPVEGQIVDNDLSMTSSIEDIANTPLNDNTSVLDLPTDLSDLSYEQAKEYVINIMTVKKQCDKELTKQTLELDQLNSAIEKSDNKNGFDQKIIELKTSLKRLNIEEMELSVKLDLLKEALKKKTQFQPNTDPNSLLENIEQTLGKSASDLKLEKETENLDLQDKLDQLKRKMSPDQ